MLYYQSARGKESEEKANVTLSYSADGVIGIQERSSIKGLLKFANITVFYSADGVICIKETSCTIESKTVI